MKTRIPPPVILLLYGAVMWLIARSQFAIPVDIPKVMVFIPGAGGIILAAVAIRSFVAAATTIDPLAPRKSSTLVTDGLYKMSRNPMYLGLLLLLTAWAVWLGSVTNILLLIAFVVTITELQIKPEEAALREIFRDDYESYCRKVRRWI
jgi:protein-S-isoprenylcysteine O-methyltransferase Ste14